MNEIGKRIKQLRGQRNVKAIELAEAIGASQGNISDWENDKKKSTPTAKYLIAIANFFDVSLDWLMTGEERTIEQETLNFDETDLAKKINLLTHDEKLKLEGIIEGFLLARELYNKKVTSPNSTSGEEAATDETA
ncbi:helix-turn-helix transcriptional regulator [Lysinibacillus macroides]|uniref:helix-turn-helix domain-containing protein n=1 Tax=Lysinibacillus macroides TaxID=33935 RepID=UPI0006B4A8C9|nr:helix-turn-helix transcriptional regulator [Lysinibacillus macroides]QPR66863.1 helix-turn-helix transcriptional regulator [Lysinibacillus macroides]